VPHRDLKSLDFGHPGSIPGVRTNLELNAIWVTVSLRLTQAVSIRGHEAEGFRSIERNFVKLCQGDGLLRLWTRFGYDLCFTRVGSQVQSLHRPPKIFQVNQTVSGACSQTPTSAVLPCRPRASCIAIISFNRHS
jgi:hypothetical protein